MYDKLEFHDQYNYHTKCTIKAIGLVKVNKMNGNKC